MTTSLMPRSVKRLILTLLGLLISILVVSAQNNPDFKNWLSVNQPGLYSVIEVTDGDTIVVNVNGSAERVRMIGVDTPELHHPQKPVQCFAHSAREFTTHLIGTEAVKLDADALDDNRDLYGRLLRYVYLTDGRLLNAELIKQGYGFAYTHFPFAKLEEFRTYEREAREESRGLWGGCSLDETDRGLQTTPFVE